MIDRSSAYSGAASEDCPVGAVCSASPFVPCIDLGRVHARKLRLCNALEKIADGLPARIDRLQCLNVASSLVPLLRECHRLEEATIFPTFGRDCGGVQIVTWLKNEHVENACAAEDLSEVLLGHGHGRPVDNPEALGYMLRSFVEGMRRHIAFERDNVLVVLKA